MTDDNIESRAGRRAEIEAEFHKASDAIPPAQAEVRRALHAYEIAQAQNNSVISRVDRATRQTGVLSAKLLAILRSERAHYDAAGSTLSKARSHLANLQWIAECRRDDLEQLDAFENPPKQAVFLEVVKRPRPPSADDFEDNIILMPASRSA